MKTTTREIVIWFVAHLAWWAVAMFAIYPFIISPFYSTLFSSGITAAQSGFYISLISFGVVLVGWCVSLVIFLSARGPRRNETVQPPAGSGPILGPQR